MRVVMGCIRPLKNWDFQAERYSFSFTPAKARSALSCAPKAFTTTCPAYISSTCPLSSPM